MNPWTTLQAFALILGLCVGSFLNVCIARMPEDRSIVHPPSHCPHCGSGIRWYDNIPILSWLLLRARCRTCKYPISATYPLVEACTGILIFLLWRRIIPSPDHLDLPHLALFAWYMAFVAMLVALTFIDLRHYIIPDQFSIYAVPVGVLGAVGISWLQPGLAPSWQQSVVGAAAGGLGLGSVAGVYWLIRRQEGLGMGDIKLMAMVGSFLGAFPALIVVLLVGSIVGSVVGLAWMTIKGKGLQSALPYGPFLAFGALVYLYFGDILVQRAFLGLDPG